MCELPISENHFKRHFAYIIHLNFLQHCEVIILCIWILPESIHSKIRIQMKWILLSLSHTTLCYRKSKSRLLLIIHFITGCLLCFSVLISTIGLIFVILMCFRVPLTLFRFSISSFQQRCDLSNMCYKYFPYLLKKLTV